MRAHQSVADAEPGAEAIVELLGLGPADYRPGQHPGQGALVGLDGFGEGAETGSAQLIAFGDGLGGIAEGADRSEEHTSELQSLMRISYAVFCLKKKKKSQHTKMKSIRTSSIKEKT